MKKFFTFIAALMFCTGLFAEETILAIGPWEAQDWTTSPTLLSDGGTELVNIGAQAGDVINFYIEPTKDDWACQIWEGHWESIYASICAPSMASTLGYNAYDLSANGGKYALTLTQEMIDAALTTQWWGGTFLINGDGVVVTKLTLATPIIFVDDQSGLTFQIIDSDDVNNVMVIFTKNGYPTYSGDIVIPSTVNYHDTTFTVTQIGDLAFKNCTGLTSITIPSSVTTIGFGAFDECSGLTSINVDAANTHFCAVDGVLFNYAKDTLIHYPMGNTRTEYTIPNSVTTIGYKAFYDCSKLTSVTIPNSVTTIGHDAFFNILNIVYNGTASGSPWGAKCINGYVDGYFVYSDATKTTLCGCSTAAIGEITIPNSVIIIGESAFHYCRDLTSVTIPNSVITIRYGAFDECSGLTSVTIGNSVTTIEGWAFHSCSSLASVTIPNSVTTIGFGAFFECSGLTSVTIGNSVKTVEMQAFGWCGSLTSVTIPNSVTTIGENAFSGCSSLTSVTIPNSVTTIGGSAFSGSGLRDVSVAWTSSDQLPTMGVGVFDNIANWTGPSAATLHVLVGTKNIYETADQWKEFGTIIESIEPQVGNKFGVDGLWYEILTMGETNTVKVINNSNYKNLQTVNIPNSITLGGIRFDVVEVGGSSFAFCKNLTSVTIGNSVTTIGWNAFYECSGLTSVTIGNSVTEIEESAFSDCKSLTSIVIPNSVITIGDYAFQSCSKLTSVTIGNSVTTIGECAFYWCEVLTSITCYAVIPPRCVGAVFSGINYNAKVYVPASALADYQNAEVWKNMQLNPIAADVTPMDDENPIVTPAEQDVTITWPITDGTNTYTLTISKNGEVVCVLTFNTDGQLLNIAFAAPGHNGAHQTPAATLTAQGFQFTVTGLTPGTDYTYSVTATDAGGQTLAEHNGNFSTTGGGTPTSINGAHDAQPTMHKVLRNGQVLLKRNNATYTLMGQKVR